MNIEVNSTYNELGANVYNANTGVTTAVVDITGTVDTSIKGTYTVTYKAERAETVTRTVNVVDTTKPVIKAEKLEISIPRGTATFDYDSLVTVTDNYDKNIKATHKGTVDTNNPGRYSIVYSAKDSSENEAEKVTITVIVTDYAPIISYYENNDEEKEPTTLVEGKVLRQHLAYVWDKGTAYYKNQEDDDTKYKEYKSVGTTQAGQYKGSILTDGKYTIKVVAEDGATTVRNFVVDTTPPTISGIANGRYTTAQTIVFEDISDVGTAILINNTTGKSTDIKEELRKQGHTTGRCTYTVGDKGTNSYTLKVEDEYGNAIAPINFVLMNIQ